MLVEFSHEHMEILALLLSGRVTEDGVIDSNSLKVVIILVIGIDEGIRNIWDVVAPVALSGQVNLISMYLEGIHKVLVKAKQLFSKFDFIGDIWDALGVSYSHWLFHPYHVCEIDPCVGILNRCLSPRVPSEWTVL